MNSIEENPVTYQSVDELVTALIEEDRTSYPEIFSSIDLPISALEPFCSWSSESYTRNCIVDSEELELILLCWDKGQKTPIHDHGGEECWVKIIQGELKETIYKVDEAGELNSVKSSISREGNVSYMIDFMGCHRLENLTENRCMSLHLYAKPIRTCQLFDEDSGKFVSKDLEYCTVPELEVNLK